MEEKNLQLERLVFFCDAVVAIAITLLALDLKPEQTASGHLTFSDLTAEWKTFLAFFLSFFNIANFWKIHHSIFSYFKKINERMLWLNILWLLCVVLLPFSTSLVSDYFTDSPAILIYSLNIFAISLFQNFIWDYAAINRQFFKPETLTTERERQYRIYFNLDMLNGIVGIVLSFRFPELAFFVLLTKLPMVIGARIYYRLNRI